MKLKALFFSLLTCAAFGSPLIEAKAGYFFFTDSDLRKIYDKGGVDLQLTGVYPIYRYLHVYGSVEYLEKSGRSLGAHQKTHVWEVPLSLGLQALFPLNESSKYYISFGPRYFFIHSHNSSTYVPSKMDKNGIGFFANTGFLFILDEHITVDVFGEYSYGKFSFHSSKPETQGQKTQIGGVAVGAGLGYSF